MVPAVLGLTAAAILSVTACFCIKHFRLRNKKLTETSTLPFQPTRRPTAVRSPSGAPPHYLKKSPSPTGPNKLPPGSNGNGGGLTPTSHHLHQQQQNLTEQQLTKYNEENEMITSSNSSVGGAKTIFTEILKTPTDLDSPTMENCDQNNETDQSTELGKLGALVFKLRYLSERSALVVSVVRCRGLPGRNGTGGGNTISQTGGTGSDVPLQGNNGKIQNATDPYVKLQLLPEKQHKVKTR